MYKLRHIFAALLSLLIIYTGAGVAIAHYCCTKCEVREVCHCSDGCNHSHATDEADDCHQDAEAHYCPDFGCSTVFYKIDLVKEASASLSIASLFTYCYQVLPDFHFASPVQDCLTATDFESPPLLSRCYLALYSVLLI